ncbi:MAG TPA: hypothetical protein VIF64_16005 [Pyrinomonadaceae bacterium]
MRRTRWLLLLTLLLFVLLTCWLWWLRPTKLDMASYAPADSMLYLEANEPSQVVETIAGTEAWRAFERAMGTPTRAPQSRWLQHVVEWTGIGPIESVILARAQVAAVVTDLGAIEEADTLRIKPEGAVLIETHTSERRIRAPVEQAVKTLAEKTYGRPTSRRFSIDGVEFIEWSAPEGSRQIVATIIGSLVIVGNTERVVQTCMAVSLGRRPSLKDDVELRRVRLQLARKHDLAFGYVPPANSARLLAVGLPLLLGRAPGDTEFQRLITNGAAKIFGSLAWTSRPYLTGIEDQYLITLQPPIAARLKPSFAVANVNSQLERLLPEDVYSVTSYRFASPATTWLSLKTAVSSQVDALSTIVFSSLLKSSLLSYGINDPDSFLSAVDGELLTLRLDENGERSILIGHVQDRSTLRDVFTKKMGLTPRNDQGQQFETFENAQGEFAASFISDFIVVGPSADVRRYSGILAVNTELNAEKLKRITFFVPSSTAANIVTYTDDGNRVRNFISAMIAAKGDPPLTPERVDAVVAGLPFSVTETTLDDQGIERITRSPLGQFSSVLPLVVPEQSGPARTGPDSR